MKNRILQIVILLSVTIVQGLAACVERLAVPSPSMNKEIPVLVVLPDIALGSEGKSCPVVYLLHGYGGNAETWINIKPDLPQIADQKGIIFVCPDARNSWYWDSPIDPAFRYETFVASELVEYVDLHYKTVTDREGRAITGLSMGGHGALWIAFRHQETFGACGSMSGCTDIRPFPKNWEISRRLGSLAENPKLWDEYTVINNLDSLRSEALAILIDCGVEDFFLDVNKELHASLLARQIDHDFTIRPGGHNRAYWHNAIDYQILFFEKYFRRYSEQQVE
ncbi:alpha/beta hydrolase [Porphyromonas gulae]|uniref:alpha/beta hydrolase n=1 Tax=Porphyromonas gulae TaxID=111105 RepID=UPI00052BFC05|nr:alpha/beta hydrolase family protein [Porphyromonas gulae]KGN70074.1 XynC protein [Porphyromonas gulae]KKC50480.1 XynC protein [Porphyromonas gulae]